MVGAEYARVNESTRNNCLQAHPFNYGDHLQSSLSPEEAVRISFVGNHLWQVEKLRRVQNI